MWANVRDSYSWITRYSFSWIAFAFAAGSEGRGEDLLQERYPLLHLLLDCSCPIDDSFGCS